MGLLAGLFDGHVATAQGDPRSLAAVMYPIEQSYVSRATESRRREFAAGRSLARQAMASLGVPQAAIPAASDRAPVWPAGIVGSISHCSGWCVAAVARESQDCSALGIDVEPATPLETDLLDTICDDDELRWLARQAEPGRGLLAKAIFSAKESVYKAQYPLSRQIIDFHAVSVALDMVSGSFLARIRVDAEPFLSGYQASGRIAITSEFIATGVALKNVKEKAAQRELSA
ncbi:4'-phosphopantetheinyl transferase family protein [Aminobacter niigataensis]|uniref:4'-phosphopantetheinyl transferase family protein n=1 Tax=Aminobacter niigataensis TaxID=83265 RepID=UPI00228364AC|nr:4'-phosphopantetheinyl transferase superfamily protein [Aminobacter niigataensis]CAI2936464.1 4'-phosphopantetheinyl transferase EntD [Aminobacter niigataensis]